MQKILVPASLGFVALVFWCLWLWQPERQVRKHHAHFLAAAEDRDWKSFRAFLAEDYRDRWGFDKATVVRETSEVLRQFIALTLTDELTGLEVGERSAVVTCTIHVEGNGTPIAQVAREHVNGLREPFVFSWRKQSWKPWDWRLQSVDQPELRVRGGF